MAEPIFRSRGCFVCGTDNPGGLDLAPQKEGEKVTLRFTPKRVHLGFSKAVHGGITASLLDEVIGVACGQQSDAKCATVELTVKYKRPLLEGVEVHAEGWCSGQDGKIMLGEGKITDPKGNVLATGTGRFLPLQAEQIQRFVGDGDGD
jgi:uncharacterized protein (TIGR00369 family)